MKTSHKLFSFFRKQKSPNIKIHSHSKKSRDIQKRPFFKTLLVGMAIAAITLGVATSGSNPDKDTAATLASQSSLSLEAKALTKHSPHSEYSHYIANLQDEWQDAKENIKIVYLDSDLINLRTTLYAGAGDKENGTRAIQLGKYLDYYLPKGQFSKNHVARMAEWLSAHEASSMTFNQTIYEADGSTRVTHSCIIIPADPNSSTRMDASGLMGVSPWQVRTLGDTTNELNIKKQIFRAYIDLHETSHCFDRRYLEPITPAMSMDKQSHWRHKGETFADVHATLQLAKSGVTNAATWIGDMRVVGTAGNGQYTPYAPKDDWSHYGAEVYYTTPALRITQDYINKTGIEKLKKMSLKQMMAKAYEIVDEHGLSYDEFMYLHDFFGGKHTPKTGKNLTKNERLLNNFLAETKRIRGTAIYAAPLKYKTLEHGIKALRNQAWPRIGDKEITKTNPLTDANLGLDTPLEIPDLIKQINALAKNIQKHDDYALAKAIAYVKNSTRIKLYNSEEANGPYNKALLILDYILGNPDKAAEERARIEKERAKKKTMPPTTQTGAKAPKSKGEVGAKANTNNGQWEADLPTLRR